MPVILIPGLPSPHLLLEEPTLPLIPALILLDDIIDGQLIFSFAPADGHPFAT
jgi:hypothetical protein